MSHCVPLRRFNFLLVAALIVCAGCGKVGDPLPPLVRIPDRISDLTAVQNQDKIVLSWTNPSKYIDGANATDLTEVRILRNGSPILSLPVTGAGKVQSVPVDAREDVGKTTIYTLEVATKRGKMSSVSNGVTMQVMDVPGIVANLSGEMDQGQIQIHWQPPAQNASLAEIYLVRRQDWDASQTVRDLRFVDTEIEAGKTYQYVISAARDSIPPVPGPPSAAVVIVAVDMTKPRPPTGLQPPVISETGASLRWDVNAETDIAGYRVYRSDNPNTGFMQLTNDVLPTPSFRDPDYRPGSYYAVSAEDGSGNVSDKSPPVRAQE